MTRRTPQILAAVADLFHKQGVVATSPDQIIDALGTGKGQFYHYFKNKEASFTRFCRPTSRRFGVEVARSATDITSWNDLQHWFIAQRPLQKGPTAPPCLRQRLHGEDARQRLLHAT